MALEARKRHTPKGQVEAGAGFWIRALARIIDVVFHHAFYVVGAVFAGILLAVLIPLGLVDPEVIQNRIEEMSGFSVLALLLALVANIGYHAICEGFGGATLGKLICGLRVIGQREGPCRFGPAVLRSFACLFDTLFFGAVGYLSMSDSALRQRFGDKWAKTMVVKTSLVPEEARRSGAMLALACLGGPIFSVATALFTFLWQIL